MAVNILHVIANPKPLKESASKAVSEEFISVVRSRGGSKVRISAVDLYRSPPPFYSYDVYRYFWYPVFDPDYAPTAREKKAAMYALKQGRLFNAADVLVLTTPMWNFGPPAILKAWMDQVLAPGLTFRIGPGGVEPLHRISRIILLCASGGAYGAGDARNCLVPMVKAAFGFIGIREVEAAWADGQNSFFYKDSALRKTKAIQTAKALAQKLTTA